MLKSMLLATAAMMLAPEGVGNGNGNGKGAKRVKSVWLDVDEEPVNKGDLGDAYRDVYRQERNAELSLTDEQIEAIVSAIPGDETGEDGDAILTQRLDALSDADDRDTLQDLITPVSAINSAVAAMAKRYGEQITAATDEMIDAVADAEETREGTPLRLAFEFCRIWGGTFDTEGNEPSGYPVLCPAVDEMPIPGTSYKAMPAGYNRPPNKYKWKDTGGTEHVGDFTRDVARSTGHGIKLSQQITDLEMMGSTGGYDKAAIKNADFIKLYADNDDNRVAKLAQLKKRETSRARATARAIAFLQVMNRIENEFPSVLWSFTVMDAPNNMEELATRNKPIKLHWKKGRETGSLKPWSLSQWNNLQLPGKDGRIRLNVAKQNGGTVAAIAETMKRKKKEAPSAQGGDQDKTGKTQGIPSPEQVEAFYFQLANGFDTGERGEFADKAATYRTKLCLMLNQEGKTADERLLTLFDAHSRFGDVLALYSKRIERITKQQAEEKETAAQAAADAKKKVA